MNWEIQHINLGAIKERVTVTMDFKYLGDKVIKEINPGCIKCTTVSYNPKTKILTAKYSPGRIPRHLEGTFYSVNIHKGIGVIYEDGSKEGLSFSAKIIK